MRRRSVPWRVTQSWVVAGTLLVLAACTAAEQSQAGHRPADAEASPLHGEFSAEVVRVVDGDTFIADHAGRDVRVRLIGVDTPETVKPDTPVQCWGPQSSRLTHRLLPVGTRIRAAYEAGGRLDQYGRDLWDVWLPDGRFLQAVLVRRGAAEAFAYRPQVARATYLAGLDAQARAAGVGRWGHCPGAG